jgi:hypothetical protein
MEFLRALNTHGRANQVVRHIRFMQANHDLKQLIARFDTTDPLDVARLQALADGFRPLESRSLQATSRSAS